MDRRGFFRHLAGQGARAVTAPPPERLRPPGALAPEPFFARCNSCHDCVDACPPAAIFTIAGGVDAGTPVMIPERTACAMCDGWPCAAACTTGALVVPETPVVKLGVARIAKDRCFVFRGPECGACARLCPDDAPALKLVAGRPTIDEDVCVGCGLCASACPTRPAAIDLTPHIYRGEEQGAEG
jgi:ferredoxin-type protein NapG